ncbi:GNAT family N-acetyltransferase [Spiroplasma endosymbiont of Nebria brevicollis]|uniref:GNAT family N-acetyltransferase n=1 Tax=Spiroplasma endosymbiont of Nebria brevicollis TaxID=3066284 RepID=UPI00313A8132
MIRHAKPNETVENIAIIINIFYEVYRSSKSKTFAKYSDSEKINLLKQIFLMKNHYFSYENYIVHEENGHINGITLVVLHQESYQLKVNTFKILSKIFQIDLDFEIENESKEKEVYLDTFGVKSDFQGQGIGTKIMLFIVEQYQEQSDISYLSLNVSFKNDKARKLYERVGFQKNGELSINYHPFYHIINLVRRSDIRDRTCNAESNIVGIPYTHRKRKTIYD